MLKRAKGTKEGERHVEDLVFMWISHVLAIAKFEDLSDLSIKG